MFGKEIKSGEGYLVEDVEMAEKFFSDFMKRGYRGIHIFRGSPLFLFENTKMFDIDKSTLRELMNDVVALLKERKRNVVFLDGSLLIDFDVRDLLRLFCLIKDYVLVNDSSMILLFKSNGDRWHGLLDREFVRVG